MLHAMIVLILEYSTTVESVSESSAYSEQYELTQLVCNLMCSRPPDALTT